jgi:hypothetical protein
LKKAFNKLFKGIRLSVLCFLIIFRLSFNYVFNSIKFSLVDEHIIVIGIVIFFVILIIIYNFRKLSKKELQEKIRFVIVYKTLGDIFIFLPVCFFYLFFPKVLNLLSLVFSPTVLGVFYLFNISSFNSIYFDFKNNTNTAKYYNIFSSLFTDLKSAILARYGNSISLSPHWRSTPFKVFQWKGGSLGPVFHRITAGGDSLGGVGEKIYCKFFKCYSPLSFSKNTIINFFDFYPNNSTNTTCNRVIDLFFGTKLNSSYFSKFFRAGIFSDNLSQFNYMNFINRFQEGMYPSETRRFISGRLFRVGFVPDFSQRIKYPLGPSFASNVIYFNPGVFRYYSDILKSLSDNGIAFRSIRYEWYVESLKSSFIDLYKRNTYPFVKPGNSFTYNISYPSPYDTYLIFNHRFIEIVSKNTFRAYWNSYLSHFNFDVDHWVNYMLYLQRDICGEKLPYWYYNTADAGHIYSYKYYKDIYPGDITPLYSCRFDKYFCIKGLQTHLFINSINLEGLIRVRDSLVLAAEKNSYWPGCTPSMSGPSRPKIRSLIQVRSVLFGVTDHSFGDFALSYVSSDLAWYRRINWRIHWLVIDTLKLCNAKMDECILQIACAKINIKLLESDNSIMSNKEHFSYVFKQARAKNPLD